MTHAIKVTCCRDEEDVAVQAAEIILDRVAAKPHAVLGLATGGTPIKTYAHVVKGAQARGLSFNQVRTFNLDEYVGLPPTHTQSYRYFMQRNLFDHLDIHVENTYLPDGMATDLEAECASYEEAILAAGGVDLWLLGIGSNGHVAFNEPGSAIDSRTRVMPLAESTIQASSDGRFFDDPKDVPRTALTVGIGTVLSARKLLLLATGAGKASAVARSVDGEVSSECPGSYLQTHADCTFLLDPAAAAELRAR